MKFKIEVDLIIIEGKVIPLIPNKVFHLDDKEDKECVRLLKSRLWI